MKENVIPHRIRYVNQQDEAFNSLAEMKEYELQKEIYKNLHGFITENLNTKYTKEFFEFLIKHRQEVILLLSNGNLETKHQGRELK